ncbi:hypothetical protein, partial [Legionella sp.]|uniref:hypothetical protein n=1 Tax=Legionella sp. TaxID=459 RepID=UPI000CAD7024
VDPTISPYKNKVSTMDLEQRIYDYQKNQSDREKDQALIKRTRLTREYFCPDPKKRAKDLYNFAAQNEGKELNITLKFSTQRHSCYLSVQHENEIRYMDSNHGVYLFRDKKEFINFYVAAAQKDKENGLNFHFYSLDELVYDGHHQLAESKTLAGKIRTLLTGRKYQNDELSATLIIQSLHFILGGTMGSLAALLMPALGESAVIIEILLAGLGATALSSLANMKGHYGLLGIPHLIQDSWHNFMDGYSEFAPSEQEQIDAENEETLESSTITALLQLENNFSNRLNNLPQPEEQEDPQESELFEAVTDTLQDQQLQEQNAYLRPNFS